MLLAMYYTLLYGYKANPSYELYTDLFYCTLEHFGARSEKACSDFPLCRLTRP